MAGVRHVNPDLVRAARRDLDGEQRLIVTLLEESLQEEERMAQWLFDRIPEAVLHTLNLPTATGSR